MWEVDEVSTKFYMVLGSVTLHVVGKSFLVLIGIGNLLNVKKEYKVIYLCFSEEGVAVGKFSWKVSGLLVQLI